MARSLRYWMLDGAPVVAAAPAFVGPLDGLPAPLAAYSFRRLLSAYVANKAVNIRRSSDNAAQDFGFDASGNFDAAGAAAFIGGGSGFIATWYDQSSNGSDQTQGTAANQPTYSATGLNSLPAGVYLMANSQRLLNIAASKAQPFTMSAVAVRTAAFTTQQTIVGPGGGFNAKLGFGASANQFLMYAGTTVTGTASDSTAHALLGAFNGASSVMAIDGAETVVSPNTNSVSQFNTGYDGSHLLSGAVGEAILWGSALGPTDRASVAALQKTYWGTP